jgi:ankyrin repeat protein
MSRYIIDMIISNDIINLEKEFRENPSKINDVDECGIDYLMYAVSSYLISEKTIKLLIRFGININQTNISNLTALHYSMCNNNMNIINLLLYNGADINRLTIENKSIYDYIELWKNYEAYNVIEDYKEDKEILCKIEILKNIKKGKITTVLLILDKEIEKFLLSKNYYLYKL